MTKAGVGLSQNLSDHKKAGFEAATQAIEKLEGTSPTILFAFSSIKYEQEAVLKGIHEAAADAPDAMGLTRPSSVQETPASIPLIRMTARIILPNTKMCRMTSCAPCCLAQRAGILPDYLCQISMCCKIVRVSPSH